MMYLPPCANRARILERYLVVVGCFGQTRRPRIEASVGGFTFSHCPVAIRVDEEVGIAAGIVDDRRTSDFGRIGLHRL